MITAHCDKTDDDDVTFYLVLCVFFALRQRQSVKQSMLEIPGRFMDG